MTRMTRTMVRNRVTLTSATDSRIDTGAVDRGYSDRPAPGSWARKEGSCALIQSTTAMVLVPGWRWMARTIARVVVPRLLYQAATLLFSTLSQTWARSSEAHRRAAALGHDQGAEGGGIRRAARWPGVVKA